MTDKNDRPKGTDVEDRVTSPTNAATAATPLQDKTRLAIDRVKGIDIEELARNADIPLDIFGERWMFDAYVYREILDALSRKFAPDAEMTNEQGYLDAQENGARTLFFDIGVGRKSYKKFADFISKNKDIIPLSLREQFEVAIGEADIRRPGFVIKRNGLEAISEADFSNLVWGDGRFTEDGERKAVPSYPADEKMSAIGIDSSEMRRRFQMLGVAITASVRSLVRQ